MGDQWNPMQALRQLTESHYGDFELDKGRLRLTFSREATGDGNLRLMLSELCSMGVLKGETGVLPFDFFDQLSPDIPINLANNADLFSGQNPDHLVVEIRTMAMV